MSLVDDLPEPIRAAAAKVRLILTDVDGVLTDGGITFDETGAESKTFNVRDGHGIKLAIRHGIEPCSGPGEVAIECKRENGMLRIDIRDNGPGLAQARDRRREGVGIRNTRSRLEQLYGDEFRFDLTNGANGGFEVTLQIPYRVGAGETGGERDG